MFTVLNYIFIALFVVFFFGFCIFIHEFGHFIVAKWRKMHINAFSIGFKTIWSFKRNGVEYRIGCLPIGGYVDLPQIDVTSEAQDEAGNTLPRAKSTDKILVAFAGPFFNILFGFVLATFLWIHGIPGTTPKMDTIKVADLEKNSPEYNAGLRKGDEIVKINGERFYANWKNIVYKIIFTKGNVDLSIKDNDGLKKISYKPKVNPKSPVAKEDLPYPFFKPKIPVVITVESGSKAAKNGLKTGDKILEVNGEEIHNFKGFLRKINQSEGKSLDIKLSRNDQKLTLENVKTYPVEEGKSYKIGIGLAPQKEGVKISKVLDGTPAEKSGIEAGDVIKAIGNKKISSVKELKTAIQKNKNNEVQLTILRNGKKQKLGITPELQTPYFINGLKVAFYNHTNPWKQFTKVLNMSYQTLTGIFSSKSKIEAKHIGGPVGIMSVIGKAVYAGSIVIALHIIVVITFSLALINLFPIPVLDGGHILISLIELVIRRPIPAGIVQPVCTFFIFLLIALMLFVTFNDVNRLTNFMEYFKQDKSKEKIQQTEKVNKHSPKPELQN